MTDTPDLASNFVVEHNARLAAEAQVSTLQADLEHWKANHADLVRKKKEHERISKERYDSLQAQVDGLREGLESIREYWNRDANHDAMVDACWYAVNLADELLSQPPADEAAKGEG